MASYNERLLDRKIEKKLQSTGGILPALRHTHEKIM